MVNLFPTLLLIVHQIASLDLTATGVLQLNEIATDGE